MTLSTFRRNVAMALDDDLHTKVWHNIIDYVIIFMIVLSTVEIYVSSLDIGPVMRNIAKYVDVIVTEFFTIEVTLRIWIAPELDPKWSGFKGRIKYCLSFYGLIDFLSTYPFYINAFLPLPYHALRVFRVFRVIRVLRLTRYSSSFSLLSLAIREKRHVLSVSMQFLLIVTVILSLLLFYCEHNAQPEVFGNAVNTTVWSLVKYVGDPGKLAETPPITFMGQVLAFFVGLLGIAIVAVPAGIIASGFTDAIENERTEKKLISDTQALENAFERKQDRATRVQVVPPFRSLVDIKARVNLSEDSTLSVVDSDANFRIINLATTVAYGETATDRLAVEHFPRNRSYGCMIDRKSRLTVVAPSNMVDACVGNFAFYLALLGGFNYISREVGEKAPYKSYYLYGSETHAGDPAFADYEADVRSLLSREDAWGVTLLASSGAEEPKLETSVHLGIGGGKGDNRLSGDGLFIRDEAAYAALLKNLSDRLGEKFGIWVDHQRFHSSSSPKLFIRQMGLAEVSNNVIMRVEWEKILYDPRRIELAREIASVISTTVLHADIPDTAGLPGKDIGFRGYIA